MKMLVTTVVLKHRVTTISTRRRTFRSRTLLRWNSSRRMNLSVTFTCCQSKEHILTLSTKTMIIFYQRVVLLQGSTTTNKQCFSQISQSWILDWGQSKITKSPGKKTMKREETLHQDWTIVVSTRSEVNICVCHRQNDLLEGLQCETCGHFD